MSIESLQWLAMEQVSFMMFECDLCKKFNRYSAFSVFNEFRDVYWIIIVTCMYYLYIHVTLVWNEQQSFYLYRFCHSFLCLNPLLHYCMIIYKPYDIKLYIYIYTISYMRSSWSILVGCIIDTRNEGIGNRSQISYIQAVLWMVSFFKMASGVVCSAIDRVLEKASSRSSTRLHHTLHDDPMDSPKLWKNYHIDSETF